MAGRATGRESPSAHARAKGFLAATRSVIKQANDDRVGVVINNGPSDRQDRLEHLQP